MDRNVHAPRMLVRSRFSVKLTALGGTPVSLATAKSGYFQEMVSGLLRLLGLSTAPFFRKSAHVRDWPHLSDSCWQGHSGGSVGKPSRCATPASWRSRVIKSSCSGCSPARSSAAANWRESAARRGWVIRSRREYRRTSLPGRISCAPANRFFSVESAFVTSARVSFPSLSQRASAERHSVSVPHQTAISLSSWRSVSIDSEVASRTNKGTIAELSQNVTVPPSALEPESPPLQRLDPPRRERWAAGQAVFWREQDFRIGRVKRPARPIARGRRSPGRARAWQSDACDQK